MPERGKLIYGSCSSLAPECTNSAAWHQLSQRQPAQTPQFATCNGCPSHKNPKPETFELRDWHEQPP